MYNYRTKFVAEIDHHLTASYMLNVCMHRAIFSDVTVFVKLCLVILSYYVTAVRANLHSPVLHLCLSQNQTIGIDCNGVIVHNHFQPFVESIWKEHVMLHQLCLYVRIIASAHLAPIVVVTSY